MCIRMEHVNTTHVLYVFHSILCVCVGVLLCINTLSTILFEVLNLFFFFWSKLFSKAQCVYVSSIVVNHDTNTSLKKNNYIRVRSNYNDINTVSVQINKNNIE